MHGKRWLKGSLLTDSHEHIGEKVELRKSVLWNSVGSLYYLGVQWLTTVLIVRIADNYVDAGLYSLAISITNIFYILAMYNVRNFQVSDVRNQYENEDYIFHRITTMFLALAACSVFVMFVYRDKYTIFVIIAYMVFKLGESLADVFHGINQKADRMDIVGKSFLIRGTIVIVFFVIAEITTKNLFMTIVIMTIMTLCAVVLYDIRMTKISFFSFEILFRKGKWKGLYRECFSFLIYGIAMNVVASIPRIIMEKMYGKELLGYYASVATPAVIVQSLANVIFVPFIPLFTGYYVEREDKKFWKLVRKMLGFCAGLGGIVYAGSVVGGRFLLEELLYHDPEIGPYCYLLNSTMICTTMVAVIWLLAIILTIDRAGTGLTVASVAGVVTEGILAAVLIYKDGIDGINRSLMCTYAVIILIMCCYIKIRFKKHFSSEQLKSDVREIKENGGKAEEEFL